MQKTKLRVLFLVNIPSPYRVDFFNELGKRCHLTVLFEKEGSLKREDSWHKYNFNNFEAIFLRGIEYRNHLISKEILKYLKRDSYDIFVIGGYSTPTGMLAIEILNYKNIPFILNVDGGMVKKDNKLTYAVKRHYISSANSWLSTGERTNEYLIHYGAKANDIFLYPFTSLFKQDLLDQPISCEDRRAIKKRLNISEDKKMILSVGRLVYEKGFDILLNSFAGVSKDVELYIIGGNPTNELLDQINRLGIKDVHFLGFMPKNKLKDYYKASELFILPTRGDVWGLVINEAMAHGLPVITTDKCVAGIELVENFENGFIFPSEDVKELTEYINYCLEDNDRLIEMSKKSLEIIRNYTMENMARTHMNIFKTFQEKYEDDRYNE